MADLAQGSVLGASGTRTIRSVPPAHAAPLRPCPPRARRHIVSPDRWPILTQRARGMACGRWCAEVRQAAVVLDAQAADAAIHVGDGGARQLLVRLRGRLRRLGQEGAQVLGAVDELAGVLLGGAQAVEGDRCALEGQRARVALARGLPVAGLREARALGEEVAATPRRRRSARCGGRIRRQTARRQAHCAWSPPALQRTTHRSCP